MGFPKVFRGLYFLRRFSSARIPTQFGEFTAYSYRNNFRNEGNIALVLGDVTAIETPLVRVHSECLTGDLIGSLRCDCGSQLRASLEMIGEEGVGILIYLRGHEGRGIGLGKKLRAYNLQDEGLDTVDANLKQGLPVDSRDYYFAAKILQDLCVSEVRLLTNNPKKKSGLESEGIGVVSRVPLETSPTEENLRYLETKKTRLGHILNN
ncbi:MAG: GTP cyclohydrolase II [Acidimicrobiales bacterium]|jgi:3,4-dihydroxy 2-butanone 4-phosphate synthase/GTP cyclohydrolase II|nr:GTP cyclohydrolase II [Acidimicrobiales bacterium]